MLSHLRMGECVGKGQFGLVYFAQDLHTGQPRAVKRISLQNSEANERDRACNETQLLKRVNHTNIVKLFNVEATNDHLYLEIEWVDGGTLREKIDNAAKQQAFFKDMTIWDWFRQLSSAVEHIHSKNIIHRDIKPHNIFMTKTGVIKLGDFGLGRLFGDSTMLTYAQVGTPYYMSPQALLGQAYYKPSDIWSLGCVLYELACLVSPFQSAGVMDVVSLAKTVCSGWCPKVVSPIAYCEELGSVVSKCLSLCPSERPSAAMIVKCAEQQYRELVLQTQKNQSVSTSPKTIPRPRTSGATLQNQIPSWHNTGSLGEPRTEAINRTSLMSAGRSAFKSVWQKPRDSIGNFRYPIPPRPATTGGVRSIIETAPSSASTYETQNTCEGSGLPNEVVNYFSSLYSSFYSKVLPCKDLARKHALLEETAEGLLCVLETETTDQAAKFTPQLIRFYSELSHELLHADSLEHSVLLRRIIQAQLQGGGDPTIVENEISQLIKSVVLHIFNRCLMNMPNEANLGPLSECLFVLMTSNTGPNEVITQLCAQVDKNNMENIPTKLKGMLGQWLSVALLQSKSETLPFYAIIRILEMLLDGDNKQESNSIANQVLVCLNILALYVRDYGNVQNLAQYQAELASIQEVANQVIQANGYKQNPLVLLMNGSEPPPLPGEGDPRCVSSRGSPNLHRDRAGTIPGHHPHRPPLDTCSPFHRMASEEDIHWASTPDSISEHWPTSPQSTGTLQASSSGPSRLSPARPRSLPQFDNALGLQAPRRPCEDKGKRFRRLMFNAANRDLDRSRSQAELRPPAPVAARSSSVPEIYYRPGAPWTEEQPGPSWHDENEDTGNILSPGTGTRRPENCTSPLPHPPRNVEHEAVSPTSASPKDEGNSPYSAHPRAVRVGAYSPREKNFTVAQTKYLPMDAMCLTGPPAEAPRMHGLRKYQSDPAFVSNLIQGHPVVDIPSFNESNFTDFAGSPIPYEDPTTCSANERILKGKHTADNDNMLGEASFPCNLRDLKSVSNAPGGAWYVHKQMEYPQEPRRLSPISNTGNSKSRKLNYQLGSIIGNGSFATVYKAVAIGTGELLAVKRIGIHLRGDASESQARAIQREIRLYQELNHPHIVSYYGTNLNEDYLDIVLEYCAGGSIAKMLEEYGIGVFKEQRLIQTYTKQIVSALEYLHKHNIVHRDLKGANVLTVHDQSMGKGIAKLGDFGCSFFTPTIARDLNMEHSLVKLRGTVAWMSPEAAWQSENVGPPSDIWSLGATVIEMVTGKPPWHDKEPGVPRLLHIGRTKEPPEFPFNISNNGHDFLSACMQIDPNERWTASELMHHPFLQNVDW